MDLPKLIEAIGGAALILFCVYSVFDNKRRTSLTNLYKESAEAQRQRANDEARARMDEQIECTRKIAGLEARVRLLESGWIKEVGIELKQQVSEAIAAWGTPSGGK